MTLTKQEIKQEANRLRKKADEISYRFKRCYNLPCAVSLNVR